MEAEMFTSFSRAQFGSSTYLRITRPAGSVCQMTMTGDSYHRRVEDGGTKRMAGVARMVADPYNDTGSSQ
jgi:hypothetical protein